MKLFSFVLSWSLRLKTRNSNEFSKESIFYSFQSVFQVSQNTKNLWNTIFFSLHIATTNFKISIHTFHLKFVLLAPIHHSPVRFLNLGTFCWHWTVPHQIREEFSEKSFISSELLTQVCQFREKQKQTLLQFVWKDSRFLCNLVANISFQCCTQQNELKVNDNFLQMLNVLCILSSSLLETGIFFLRVSLPSWHFF